MGMLSDFFVATPDEVASFDLDELPADHFPTLRLEGIDPLAVAMLHTLLVDAQVSDVARVLARSPQSVRAHDDPESGMEICELDADLVERLATSSLAERASVAARWAATSEMSGWDLDELASVLGDLHELVARPRRADQRVHLWVCL